MPVEPTARLGPGVVGRDTETARIAQFVARSRGGSDAGGRLLAITGPAGIGKTTIWRRAIEDLRAADTQVLVALPTPDELQAAMVGLYDLFGQLEGEPEALDPGLFDPDTEIFTRGRLVLSTLRRLSEERQVVLAIDNLQWLDPITVRSLRYALRRLGTDDVTVLVTLSTPDEAKSASLLASGDTESLAVEPLSLSGLRAVLETHEIVVSRPSLELLHHVSGGNPALAIDLARSIDLSGDRLALAELPSLSSLTSTRLTRMTPAVADVVRICAVLGPATLELVEAAGVAVDALADAVSDGAILVNDAMVARCASPVLGSAALGELAPSERRELHGRIASVHTDRDERARHLALSHVDRDTVVADELDDASSRAARRGAPGLAAELLAHSRRLTPFDDLEALGRRTVLEVLRRAAAGETDRALSMIDDLLGMLPPGRDRASLLMLRVGLDFRRSDELLVRALEEAGDDGALRGRVFDQMAFAACSYQGDFGRAEELAASALDIALELGDVELRILATGTFADASALSGKPRPELLEHAVRLRERSGLRLGRWPEQYLARQALWGGRLAEAARLFGELARQCQEAGIEFQRPFRLFDLALVEVGSGRLSEAAELVDDGIASAGDAGNEQAEIWLQYPAGLVAAHSGGDCGGVDAEAASARLLQWGVQHDEPPRIVMAHHVRGVYELAHGRADEAFAALIDGTELIRELGHRHPGSIPVLPDAIEAGIACGRREEAGDIFDDLLDQTAGLDEPWVDAAALRARGLVGLDAGDRSSWEHFEASAGQFESLGYHLDAARAMLLQGRALRRLGRRRAAGSVLTDACRRFKQMGASPWFRQANEELDRVAPGRSSGELTPTENKIAALIADGLRNREIAESLFVSVATVEAHLTRTYRKLGIRSRTDLAQHVRVRPGGRRG